jgi:hypothetical protein
MTSGGTYVISKFLERAVTWRILPKLGYNNMKLCSDLRNCEKLKIFVYEMLMFWEGAHESLPFFKPSRHVAHPPKN